MPSRYDLLEALEVLLLDGAAAFIQQSQAQPTSSAVAAYACMEDARIWLRAEILSDQGGEIQRGEIRFVPGEPAPAALAAELLARATPDLRGMFAP